MPRRALILLVFLAVLIAVPAPAEAAPPTCSYDAAAHRLSVSTATQFGDYALTTLGRAGDAIVLLHGGTPIDCAGPDATVTNTDEVAVSLSYQARFAFDLSGGPFAPGFTPESGGASQIEIRATGLLEGQWPIYVLGTDAADSFTAATRMVDGVWKTFLTGDIRIAASGTPRLTFDVRGGDDVIDAAGGRLWRALSVDAGDGDDTVSAGLGPASFRGGPGNDILRGGGSVNTLEGQEGNDTLVGAAGRDWFAPGPGDDVVKGTNAGSQDTLAYAPKTSIDRPQPGPAGVRVDLALTRPQDTGQGIDTISGGIEVLYGTAGPDVLRGTARAELILGLAGNDLLEPRGGDDRIEGSSGTDTADYHAAPGPVQMRLPATFNNPDGYGGVDDQFAIESVVGGAAADVLTGDGLDNRLDGGLGADTLDGGGGADTLLPGTGANGGTDGAADTVDGGDGLDDTLSYKGRTWPVAVRLDGLRNDGADPDHDGFSSASEEGDLATGVERAIGGGGADVLVAPGAEVNVLDGGPGADFLDAFDGTSAVDRLICGLGADNSRSDPSDALSACETPLP
ncbi:MAG TPA: calcium-binding protein [Solirubrobacteraceae bacterium]|jgi:Ca2+-binding RTX toxin-like protein